MSVKKSIVDQLAVALGRRDEVPNVQLAEKICQKGDTEAVRELIALLQHKSPGIRNDAIKVLYEIGERTPELIRSYVSVFVSALQAKDNRMKWGAMSALSAVSSAYPELLIVHLAEVVEAMDMGSVITRDHGIYILSNVATLRKHHADCMELLLEQLEKSPVNQVPMYAEKIAEVISPLYVKRFEKILRSRHDVFAIPTKQKRIEKLLSQL